MRAWIRDRSLGIFFCSVFLVTWIGQLVVEWLDFVNDQAGHGEKAEFWSEPFWVSCGISGGLLGSGSGVAASRAGSLGSGAGVAVSGAGSLGSGSGVSVPGGGASVPDAGAVASGTPGSVVSVVVIVELDDSPSFPVVACAVAGAISAPKSANAATIVAVLETFPIFILKPSPSCDLTR